MSRPSTRARAFGLAAGLFVLSANPAHAALCASLQTLHAVPLHSAAP